MYTHGGDRLQGHLVCLLDDRSQASAYGGEYLESGFWLFPSGSALPEAMPDMSLLHYTGGCP
jgi:hypothetical protein